MGRGGVYPPGLPEWRTGVENDDDQMTGKAGTKIAEAL